MEIDHIGYAVRRIGRAIDAFKKLGFACGPVIEDEDRNIEVAFCDKDGYRIELVSPLHKEMESPVDQYLRCNVGTPYHICYQSSDFEADINRLLGQGFRIIIEPRPAVALGGRKVVFLASVGIGLMEIAEI